DLDALIDGFDLLGLDTYNEKRSALLNLIDQWGHKNQLTEDLNGKKIKDIVSKYSWGERYRRLKDLVTEQASKRILTPEEIGEINLLFSEETNNVRRQVLSEPLFDRTNLNELIVELWKEKTYILSKGAIENYYPENTTGPDKPTKALNAVLAVDDKYIENPNLIIEAFGQKQNEIHEILKHVFAN
ncbi:MAG: hypothetical protein JST49_09055, partial [Bacteroidetes bacterium]|nr:hypothetical protein [Bacteroidota bacterium]